MTDSHAPAETVVARLYGVVLDCPDVAELARFWQALLGYEVANAEDDWVSLVDPADRTRRLSMQYDEDFVPSTWPAGDVPQQAHLDLVVDDLAEADVRALGLGAVPLAEMHSDGNEALRVYRDPAGHPFCLIQQLRQPGT